MVSMDHPMLCNCGLLYDLAKSALYTNEADLTLETAFDTNPNRAPEIPMVEKNAAPSKGMTPLDAYKMATTSNVQATCINKRADGHPCWNIDMVAHMPLNAVKATNTNRAPQMANDVWGWTHSNSGREFIIWGVREGHFFLEVKNGSELVIKGFLPVTQGYALQHDMKVVGDFAYMGAEDGGHGMQIFDMRRLLSITTCQQPKYCRKLDWDALYEGTDSYKVRNSHNIVANEDSNYVYIVGGNNGCKGGLHVVDVSSPKNPKFVACFGDDGYVHDAQCVKYTGPDTRYRNKEICFCYNGNTVTIVDVSNKSNIQMISRTGYSKVGYTHQGWLSSDQTHVVFGDEADEDGSSNTRTLVMNVKNLENPTNFKVWSGPTKAVDHNQYIIKATAEGQDYDPIKHKNTDLVYQANYASGLSILQVLDYESGSFFEVGYFDTYPLDDGANFNGAWSVYPYFRSGVIVVSSIKEGLYLLKPDLEGSLKNPQTAPTPAPVAAPTTSNNNNNNNNNNNKPFCSDRPVRYDNKRAKNCKWVGKAYTKLRCKKVWNGKKLWSYCRETCGRAGLGPCKRKFAKEENSSSAKGGLSAEVSDAPEGNPDEEGNNVFTHYYPI